ncbi:MAG: FAD-dependent oxidoreductase [Pseudoflavonifractor sp.]
MKQKWLSCALALTLALTCLAGCAPKQTAQPAGPKDGTYTAKAAGNNGDVTVEVTVKDGKVSLVNVKEHSETAGVSDLALSQIPQQIVDNQSLGIDAISGATNTSNAILTAVAAALTEAGFDAEEWKTRPVTAAPTAPAQADVTCATVVVGAGGAGMRTALVLKEAGHDVLLIEKMPFVGGATNLAATYFVAVDTKVQQDAGLGITVTDYVAKQAKAKPGLNTENLTKMLNASQADVDWLNSIGMNLTRPMSNYQVAPEDGSSLGVGMVKAMQSELDRVGVECRLDTAAEKLLVKDGKVVGVAVTDKSGSYNIFADQVVLATGGFACGAEAVAKYAPDWAGLPATSAVGSTGDGARMAEEIGASLKFMDSVRLNPSVHSQDGVNSSLSAARAEGGIMVNLKGERFCNDYFPDYTQLSKWMMEQEGDHVYTVIDQKSMDASKRLQSFKDKGYFLSADTPEALAKLMGVPEEQFAKTIATYSASVKSGTDEVFGRASNMSTDFTTPPYYAAVTSPGIQVTLGGVEVNENMQVLGTDGKTFENLFAVGEVAHDGLFGSAPTHINLFFGKQVAEFILAK